MAAGPERARAFTLAGADAAFVDDPYPTYTALREHDPVHLIAPGSWLLTRYDDVLAVYRDPRASSDKKREFATRRCTRACAGCSSARSTSRPSRAWKPGWWRWSTA